MQQFTGIEYIKMDIAASFGMDKKDWDERLQWFEDNKKYHEFATQSELVDFVSKAEEPAQALAGIFAYRAAAFGQATGYLCGLDATASGIQLLSLLAGCEVSARNCNLVNVGKRVDSYTLLYDAMNKVLNTNGQIPRKQVKNALMTHMYSSKAVPKQTFGEDTPELKAFYELVDELLPGANALNHAMLKLWQPDALAHSWTMPDGFEVVVKVMGSVDHEIGFLGKTFTVTERVNQPQMTGLSMGANIIHSIDGLVVREMNRRCNYTYETFLTLTNALTEGQGTSTMRQKDISLLRLLCLFDMTKFMSAAIFEYVDELNVGHLDPVQRSALVGLINSTPQLAFPIVCVHDCFKFHANYGNDVRQQYAQILSELAASDILACIASEITGRTITVDKLSDNLPHLIADSEYAIC